MRKLLLVFACFALMSVFIPSCSSGEHAQQVSKNALTFKESIEKSLLPLANSGMPSNMAKTRGGNTADEESIITLNVEFPEGTPQEIKDLVSSASTVYDLYALHEMTAADIKEAAEGAGGSEYQINISESDVCAALEPMVVQSKLYFERLGFSAGEIDSMVLENNGTYHDLILTALLLVEQELEEAEEVTAKMKSKAIPGITICSAATRDDVVHCGMVALGVDIFTLLSLSNAKMWSKVVIKKLFKTVASKLLGPVGVSLAILQFVLCLEPKIYTCIYMGKISDFEDKCQQVYDSLGHGKPEKMQ